MSTGGQRPSLEQLLDQLAALDSAMPRLDPSFEAVKAARKARDDLAMQIVQAIAGQEPQPKQRSFIERIFG